jgi:hypothetical protein
MHNFHYLQSSFDSWKVVAVLGAILLFIAFLIMIIRKYDMGLNGLTGVEKRSLSREQREILAMLRQHGNSMLQTEIADNIAGDLIYVVDVLLELEKKAKVRRYWDADRGVYLVSAVG